MTASFMVTIEHHARHRGFVIFQEVAGRAIHALLRGENTVDGCLSELIDRYEDCMRGQNDV